MYKPLHPVSSIGVQPFVLVTLNVYNCLLDIKLQQCTKCAALPETTSSPVCLPTAHLPFLSFLHLYLPVFFFSFRTTASNVRFYYIMKV